MQRVKSKSKSGSFTFDSISKILLLVIIIWFSFTFLILPVFNIFKNSFVVNGSLSFDAVNKILKSERAMKAIKNSFINGVVLTITVNILGTFLVLVTEYFDIPGQKLLRLGYMSTLVFASLIQVNGYLFTYGSNGIITQVLMKFFPNMNPNWFVGMPAVLFNMTLGCTYNHMMFMRNSIRSFDNSVIDAGKNLGAGQWEILRKIVFPTLKPVFFTLIVMTFAIGLGAFSAPLILGGENYQTIAPMILTFAGRPKSRDLAAVLSLLLGIAQVILLIVITKGEKDGNYLSVSKSKAALVKQKIENPFVNVIIQVLAWLIWILYLLPLVVVILFSFMNPASIARRTLDFSKFTIENYVTILSDSNTYGPLVRSGIYSAIAAFFSVLFMLLVVRMIMKNPRNKFNTVIEYVFFIPWLLPEILLALGFLVTYDRPSILLFGKSVIGQAWILPVAYMVAQLPNTLRYIKSAYYSFDESLEDASKNLGASGFKTFKDIILPALMPTLLALFALNLNGKLNEYNMTAFLYPPGKETMGIIIRNNASSEASVQAIAINLVYSVILVFASSIIMYIVYGRGSKIAEESGGRGEGKKKRKIFKFSKNKSQGNNN